MADNHGRTMVKRCVAPFLAASLIASTAASATQAVEKQPVQPMEETGRAAPSEADLLASVFRYLKLSRPQITYLRILAQQGVRRREALEAELLPRDVQPPAEPREPSEATPASLARKRIADTLGSEGALPLARILTREQIALAWRLAQGSPPVYAQADPSLLSPAGGFSSSRRILLGGLEVEGLATTDLSERIDTYLSTRLGAASPSATRSLREEFILGRSSMRVRGDKPFPQLVVEAQDLNELTFAVEPLSRRLFNSPELLTAIYAALRNGTAARSTPAITRISNPRRIREYEMERGFHDRTGQGLALEPLGGELRQGFYHFAPGQGLFLANAGVTSQYALQFTFRHQSGDSYEKLVDFKNRTRDVGLYLHQGRLEFYQHAVGGTPRPGVEHRVRLERDRATRIVRGYLDMVPVFSFLDLDDEAVFENGAASFFIDDRSTGGEQGAGALRSLSIWGLTARK